MPFFPVYSMSHPISLITGDDPARSKIVDSKPYVEFRANNARTKVTVGEKAWTMYEINRPREGYNENSTQFPIILLGGTTATAESFFYMLQVFRNTTKYHVIAAQAPAYWTSQEFAVGINGFLRAQGIPKAHFYGISLGAYLFLHFAALYPRKVASLALTNAFTDTHDFAQSSWFVASLAYMPSFFLLNYMLESFPQRSPFPDVVDFIVTHLEEVEQEDLASRLTLNLSDSEVLRVAVPPHKMLFLDTDDIVLPGSMRARLYTTFPRVTVRKIENGGDFPMLSVPIALVSEIVQHIQSIGGQQEKSSTNSGMDSGLRASTATGVEVGAILQFDADEALSCDDDDDGNDEGNANDGVRYQPYASAILSTPATTSIKTPASTPSLPTSSASAHAALTSAPTVSSVSTAPVSLFDSTSTKLPTSVSGVDIFADDDDDGKHDDKGNNCDTSVQVAAVKVPHTQGSTQVQVRAEADVQPQPHPEPTSTTPTSTSTASATATTAGAGAGVVTAARTPAAAKRTAPGTAGASTTSRPANAATSANTTQRLAATAASTATPQRPAAATAGAIQRPATTTGTTTPRPTAVASSTTQRPAATAAGVATQRPIAATGATTQRPNASAAATQRPITATTATTQRPATTVSPRTTVVVTLTTARASVPATGSTTTANPTRTTATTTATPITTSATATTITPANTTISTATTSRLSAAELEALRKELEDDWE